MKTVAWTIISIGIEAMLFLWLVLYMTGCASVQNPPMPLQSAEIISHQEIVVPYPTHYLSWSYPSNQLPLVFFTVIEATNLPANFYTIGTTTNLFFPLMDWGNAPAEFWNCGASWRDTNFN